MSEILKTPGHITVNGEQLREHPFAACEIAERDATIARLRAQLAAAEKVIETVRDYRKCWIDWDRDIGSKPNWDRDGFDEQAAERLASYDATKEPAT